MRHILKRFLSYVSCSQKLTEMQLKNTQGYVGYLIGSVLIVFVWLINKGLHLVDSKPV